MATSTTICNEALIAVGAKTILNLDEDSTEGKICNRQYTTWRDQEIAKHPWNFALIRKSIASSTTDPVWGFDKKLTLPSDLLRLYKVDIPRDNYKVEGKSLFCNFDEVKILYIARITNENLFSVFFIEALAARIAYELAIPLKEDKVLKRDLKIDYREKISIAGFSDAVEDRPDEVEADLWLDSRI